MFSLSRGRPDKHRRACTSYSRTRNICFTYKQPTHTYLYKKLEYTLYWDVIKRKFLELVLEELTGFSFYANVNITSQDLLCTKQLKRNVLKDKKQNCGFLILYF